VFAATFIRAANADGIRADATFYRPSFQVMPQGFAAYITLDLMPISPAIKASAYLQFTSPTGEGFQLEICAADENGVLIKDASYPLATILADDQEVRWFEFCTANGPVRLPLAEIERAIEVAKSDVHGEAWYDRPKDEV
jgi:hypothetical protein